MPEIGSAEEKPPPIAVRLPLIVPVWPATGANATLSVQLCPEVRLAEQVLFEMAKPEEAVTENPLIGAPVLLVNVTGIGDEVVPSNWLAKDKDGTL